MSARRDPLAEGVGVAGSVRRSVRVKTAAAILDCDAKQIRGLLRQGLLEGHRLGVRGVRVYLDSIDDYRAGRPLAPARVLDERRTATDKPTPAFKEAMASLKELGIL